MYSCKKQEKTEEEKRVINQVNNLKSTYPNFYIKIKRVVRILLLIPILIWVMYLFGDYGIIIVYSSFDKGDVLTFYGAFLTFLGTISLGGLALWQNRIIYNKTKKEEISIGFQFIGKRMCFVVENTGDSDIKNLDIVFDEDSIKCATEPFKKHLITLKKAQLNLSTRQKYHIYVDISGNQQTFLNCGNVEIVCVYLDNKNKENVKSFYFDMEIYKDIILDSKSDIENLKTTIKEELDKINKTLASLKMEEK